jgi:hypothetical protein
MTGVVNAGGVAAAVVAAVGGEDGVMKKGRCTTVRRMALTSLRRAKVAPQVMTTSQSLGRGIARMARTVTVSHNVPSS